MRKVQSRATVNPGQARNSLLSSVSRADILFILAIVFLAFTVRCVSLTDNGITSDEPIYVASGIKYIENILNLDLNSPYWGSNLEHPPVSKYIYGIAAMLVNGSTVLDSSFTAAKLASAMMGVLTCVLVYLIGRDFFTRGTGLAAAAILALLPTVIAHTQVATLESPLALFTTLAIYLYMLALKKGNRGFLLGSAVAFGLIISTKYNGLIVLPVLGLLFLVYRLHQLKAQHGKLDLGVLRENIKVLVPVESAVTFLGIAAVLFFALWPMLWTGPVPHLVQSLSHWTYDITEYFLGSRVAPPLYYYPVYFAVTLPALLFVPLALGVWDVTKSRDPFKIGILLWFLIPFAYGLSSFVQDGIRYIFIIYPAVALLCALGIARAADLASDVASRKFCPVSAARASAVILALVLVYLVYTVASFYPYYLDYYNEFTGGPANVQEHRLFKFGWWGEGIRECMDWLGGTAPSGASVLLLTLPQDPANTIFYTHDQRYYFTSCNDTNTHHQVYCFSQQPYLLNTSGQITPVVPDYVIINQKMMEDHNVTLDDPAYTLVYQATIQGAPLAQVYHRKSA